MSVSNTPNITAEVSSMSSHETYASGSGSSEPIAILHPVAREAQSTSFLNWHSSPTDSVTSIISSPSSSFLQDISSPTSSFDSDCPLSPIEPNSSAQLHALNWRTAATEAAAGIHYVLESFPAPGATVVGPPFRNEPLKVDAGARVTVLDEVGEYSLRVRVVETGEVGLLPSWNVEDALERLARLNMEFNEAVRTSPSEPSSLSIEI